LASVRIPAGWVAAGQGLPAVCAKHGEQAITGKNVPLISKPPGWSYVLLLLGAIPFLIVVMVTRKTVKAQNWPWCAKCGAQRKQFLAIGLITLFASLVLMVVMFASGNSTLAILGLLFLVLALVGLIVAVRGSNAAMIGATVTRDGQWVEVPKASDAFAAQATAMQAQAQAQHGGYQQPQIR
jgi:hypothetical protein